MELQQGNQATTYLSFQINDDYFATEVKHVHQVVCFQSLTQMPGAPPFMRGIINLRGMVIPIVDLRKKFGLKEREPDCEERIIVIDLVVDDCMLVVGALADAVHDVFELNPGDIEPVPKHSFTEKMTHIHGIGRRDDNFIIILNFEQIFSTDEVLSLGSFETAN